MTVVDRIPDDEDKIYFGAWVRLVDKKQQEAVYRIVGPDEFDPKLGFISMDSPMGKILLGKSHGEVFSLELDNKVKSYTIVEVSYSAIQ